MGKRAVQKSSKNSVHCNKVLLNKETTWQPYKNIAVSIIKF